MLSLNSKQLRDMETDYEAERDTIRTGRSGTTGVGEPGNGPLAELLVGRGAGPVRRPVCRCEPRQARRGRGPVGGRVATETGQIGCDQGSDFLPGAAGCLHHLSASPLRRQTGERCSSWLNCDGLSDSVFNAPRCRAIISEALRAKQAKGVL